MFDDPSIGALQAALRGLSARQQAVSDDIANVNTPYFRARRVSFEADLSSALASGQDPSTLTPTTVPTTDAPQANGNNVNINAETMIGVDTEMKYNLALRAVGDRFTLLSTAAKGS